MPTIVRLKFTITMLIILIAAGLCVSSHDGPTDEAVQQRVGFSMRLAAHGQLYRGLTSLLFTAGGWRFYGSLAMFAVAVGYAEWKSGTIGSIAVFFGVHVATLVTMMLLVWTWSVFSETHRGTLLWHVHDVGPSAGYYGCLGFAIAAFASKYRRLMVAGFMVILIARVSCSCIHLPEAGQVLSADLAHVIAFPLGMLCASCRSKSAATVTQLNEN